MKNFRIEQLSEKTLNDATKLRDKTIRGLSKLDKKTLIASLDKEHYIQSYKDNDIDEMNFWVLLDGDNVVGLTGLYSEPSDEKTSCWLGWFCVEESYRGQGFGKQLLDFSIAQAKALHKTELKLYTYDDVEYQNAISLYKKYGFKKYKSFRENSNKDLYYKLKLTKEL